MVSELSEEQRDLLEGLLLKHGLTGNLPVPTKERIPLASAAAGTPLSEREFEVLLLIGEGLSNREIATRLYLSEETIKSHLRKTLAKLQANNRAHAIAIAFRHGLLA